MEKVISARKPGRIRSALVAAMLAVLGGTTVGGEGAHAEPTVVNLYTYHTHAPFITGENRGLSYDLARYLTERSEGVLRFKIVTASRPRINKLVAGRKTGLVPWVNPVWFQDREEKHYLWSATVLMNDANAMLSHRRNPIDYHGPQMLEGLSFGGIKGHKYTDIDDFIAAGNSARRMDADNHADNLGKLLAGDIDIMLMPQSGALYMIAKSSLQADVFVSPTPHSRYERRMLTIGMDKDLRDRIDVLFQAGHEAWQAVVTAYE